jgi:hypothetical protein
MAFFANLNDVFSKSLYSGLPVPNVNFTNKQWSTTNALHFGVLIPALKAHVGKRIQSGSRRDGPYTVDAHEHNLLTAPGLRGGHIQRSHNGICSTISDGLREAQIPHRGGGTGRSCNGIFRRACPAMTDEDFGFAVKQRLQRLLLPAHSWKRPFLTADSPETSPFFNDSRRSKLGFLLSLFAPAGVVKKTKTS